ncbi:MAG: helix-turn-helix domain-containing protein [Phycisphaeraceae bacterium]
MNNSLLTTEQVASRLNVNPGTLRVWRCTKRYDLPFLRIGGAVRYEREAVEAFIVRQRQKADAEEGSRNG